MSEDRDPYTSYARSLRFLAAVTNWKLPVATLEAGGFTREDISVMASHEAVVENLNHRFETITQMEDDPRVPQTAFIAKSDLTAGKAAVIGIPFYIGATVGSLAVVASGGALALAIAAAVSGGLVGGGLGGLAAHAIGEKHAESLQEHIAAGGLLLWVRISDRAREDRGNRSVDRERW